MTQVRINLVKFGLFTHT